MVGKCDIVDFFSPDGSPRLPRKGETVGGIARWEGEGDGATGDGWGSENEDEMTMRVAMARRKLNALKKCREQVREVGKVQYVCEEDGWVSKLYVFREIAATAEV